MAQSEEVQQLLTEFEQRLMDKVKAELARANQDLITYGKATISIMYAETIRVETVDGTDY